MNSSFDHSSLVLKGGATSKIVYGTCICWFLIHLCLLVSLFLAVIQTAILRDSYFPMTRSISLLSVLFANQLVMHNLLHVLHILSGLGHMPY